jgi:glycogen debranching enzyme
MKRIVDILPSIPKPHEAVPLPNLALREVTAKNNRTVYASSDKFYKDAEFGRDALEVAEDIMFYKPQLACNILLSHARLQGVEENDSNEESRGKSIHEYRAVIVDGKHISPEIHDIFKRLSYRWGGNDKEVFYYGTVDTTPLFIRTLHRYCQLKGKSILDKSITLKRNNETITMLEAAARALNFIFTQLEASNSGMLEYKLRNPHGDLNQTWKDSEESYIHEDGRTANHNKPVSSIEVQGLVYDALLAAAQLKLDDAEKCLAAARKLRQITFKHLWLPDKQYFALGTDYDENDKLRVLKTPMANAGALLDTKVFDGLPEEEAQKYLTGIIKTMFGKDFLTSVGLRSRSLACAHLVPFWDYHGSYVSWPKETYDIAKGLERQGFPELAKQLENRLLNVVLKTRQYAEFFYVDEHGRILMYAANPNRDSEVFIIESMNKPETIQAWTVSAIYAITARRIDQKLKLAKKVTPLGWQAALERKIMARIPTVDRIINPFVLFSDYKTYKYTLKEMRN